MGFVEAVTGEFLDLNEDVRGRSLVNTILNRTVDEILPLSQMIREMFMRDESVQALKRQARIEGMNTLFESGLRKVFKGITSLEELFRIASAAEDEDSMTDGEGKPGEAAKRGKPLLEELPEELVSGII